jgi:hypothetical protein
MKEKSKHFILGILLIIFVALVVVPKPGYAKIVEMPGYKSTGLYGPTCECGWWPPECGCIIMFQE